MFETRLTQSIKSLDFTKMLESSNVSPTLAFRAPSCGLCSRAQAAPCIQALLLKYPYALAQYPRSYICNLLLCALQVDRVISEADGYQPHLVAPEMGYRRLLQECLILFKVRRQ